MTYSISKNADKQLKKLPREIQRKFIKQLNFLLKNPQHPSLRARKKSGTNIYEARIDDHYRFTYLFESDEATIVTVGPHDEGLGKK